MDDFEIDAFKFCRVKDHREGDIAVANLARLAEESINHSGNLHWQLQGGMSRLGHPQLALSIEGNICLMCQRCLTPFEFGITSHAMLVLATDEGIADEMDGLLTEDEVEIIVGSHSLDIRQIIEDDVLLAIPLSPKHEFCPSQLMLVAETLEIEKTSPFAVLKDFKAQ